MRMRETLISLVLLKPSNEEHISELSLGPSCP